MTAKNEIEIHIFGGSDEIYEQLFPKTGEIINKEFGALKKRYNKKDMFSFFKKNLDVVWIGYKYPEPDKDNYKSVLFKSFKTISSSPNINLLL